VSLAAKMGWVPFLEFLWRETGTVHHRITSFSRRATATYASIRVILALMEGGGAALQTGLERFLLREIFLTPEIFP